MAGNIAERWRVLSGENKWEGLLDPVDDDLCRYLIHYGDKAEAAHLVFNAEEKSKNCGLPRYSKKTMFSKVGLEKGNPYSYEVRKYFYGTTSLVSLHGNYIVKSFSSEASAGNSNMLGYVAVATDAGKIVLGRRDILISWRGTEGKAEGENDLNAELVSASDILGNTVLNPRVHKGWHSLYTSVDPGSKYNSTSCRDQIIAAIEELLEEYKGEEISITVTGHSMGAALATLNAMDIVHNAKNNNSMVTAIVFASPRFGNTDVAIMAPLLKNLHVLRVTNVTDLVPNFPIYIFPLFDYVHVGQELKIDTTKSQYLKNDLEKLAQLSLAHQLSVYLHGIDGTEGVEESDGFELKIKRDINLVNQITDGLRDEYLVVGNWWVEKNKSMVQMDDGSWVLEDHERDDDNDL